MYYISENIQELEDYNTLVSQGEDYNGTTQKWAEVIKHYNQDLYAIIVNEKYTTTLETLDSLDGWYNLEINE